jgi:hypothetical protein
MFIKYVIYKPDLDELVLVKRYLMRQLAQLSFFKSYGLLKTELIKAKTSYGNSLVQSELSSSKLLIPRLPDSYFLPYCWC